MRLIDADALEQMGYVLTRTYQQDKETMVCETKKLSDVPSVQLQRKSGKWEKENWFSNSTIYKYTCLECGAHHRAMYDYCPTCGAYMRGESDG